MVGQTRRRLSFLEIAQGATHGPGSTPRQGRVRETLAPTERETHSDGRGAWRMASYDSGFYGELTGELFTHWKPLDAPTAQTEGE